MTLIKISLVTPLADGTTTAATGGLRFTPTARWTIVGTPDQVVLPKSFQVTLVAGTADVTLAPTAAGWVWRIDEHLAGSPARTIYVTVPDVASIDYPDLVPVDPATLTPAAPLAPAWVSSQNLALARTPEVLIVGTITRDVNGAPTSAAVAWPDGTTGVYTGTASVTFPGSIDAYTITYGTTRTYTQPAVTRDAAGNITAQPAIVIS